MRVYVYVCERLQTTICITTYTAGYYIRVSQRAVYSYQLITCVLLSQSRHASPLRKTCREIETFVFISRAVGGQEDSLLFAYSGPIVILPVDYCAYVYIRTVCVTHIIVMYTLIYTHCTCMYIMREYNL